MTAIQTYGRNLFSDADSVTAMQTHGRNLFCDADSVIAMQSHGRNSLDHAETGQLGRAHSLATAQSEGLVTASSKSLGSHVHGQPSKQTSSRRSLDSKGGSRFVIVQL